LAYPVASSVGSSSCTLRTEAAARSTSPVQGLDTLAPKLAGWRAPHGQSASVIRPREVIMRCAREVSRRCGEPTNIPPRFHKSSYAASYRQRTPTHHEARPILCALIGWRAGYARSPRGWRETTNVGRRGVSITCTLPPAATRSAGRDWRIVPRRPRGGWGHEMRRCCVCRARRGLCVAPARPGCARSVPMRRVGNWGTG
jgi:hypothetical protein